MTSSDKNTANKRASQLATLRKVWRYIRGRRLLLALSVSCAVVSTLVAMYVPKLVGRGVDLIVGPGQVDFKGIGVVALEIVVCAVVVALAQLATTLCNNRVAFGVVRDIRRDAFQRVQELPLKYIDARQYGETTSRIVADADVFADGLLLGFSQLFTGIVAIGAVLGFMLSISVPITLVVVALTPASFVVAGFISKKTYSFFRKQSELRGELNGYVVETTQGAKVMQAFDRADASEAEFAKIDGELAAASLKATFYSSLTNPATRFVNSLVYAGVGVVGALAVVHGRLTVGQLVTFLSYADQYTKPFNEISSVATEFQNALACVERLFELVEETPQSPDPDDAAAPDAFRGEVGFDDVSFSYLPDRPLIEGFSLKVEPGWHVAIVGPTGCGKTTLVNLLMRFYDVNAGAIRVDGLDSRNLTRRALREGFGMVLQETWLKSGTVRDNILMGKTDVDEETFRRAAEACHLDGFVGRLPDGYDTVVSENGEEFSQGQRQLICIARVMVRNPQLLILDEATSSIDTRTELKVQSAFDSLTTGRTSFVVAHRLSTIREADMILAMKDGAIVEQGTHEELLAKRGFYYELYMSQFPS